MCSLVVQKVVLPFFQCLLYTLHVFIQRENVIKMGKKGKKSKKEKEERIRTTSEYKDREEKNKNKTKQEQEVDCRLQRKEYTLVYSSHLGGILSLNICFPIRTFISGYPVVIAAIAFTVFIFFLLLRLQGQAILKVGILLVRV